MLPEHNLEREFALLMLELYLKQFPERAKILAVNHYEDYMNLSDDYKLLRMSFEALQMENIRLKSALDAKRSPQLPSFIKNFSS